MALIYIDIKLIKSANYANSISTHTIVILSLSSNSLYFRYLRRTICMTICSLALAHETRNILIHMFSKKIVSFIFVYETERNYLCK